MPAAPAPETPRPSPCVNCGGDAPGRFCPACGQPIPAGRFTLRRVFATVARDAFNLERGFPATVLALSTRPGAAIREYLAGCTVRYTNPVKYLLLWVALGTFATLGLDLLDRHLPLLLPDPETAEAEQVARFFEVLGRYFNLVLLLGVPFLALFSRWLFRRAGYNLAEHLIFNSYAYGHQTALFLLFAPVFLLPPGSGWTLVLGYAAYMIVITLYYVWASVTFFQVGRARGILLSNAVLVLGYATYYGVLALLLRWLVVPGA